MNYIPARDVRVGRNEVVSNNSPRQITTQRQNPAYRPALLLNFVAIITRKHILALLFAAVLMTLPCAAGSRESISLLNSTNLALMFDNYFTYLYDTHGCLHFTPADIYLLANTIPKGLPLEIKSYSETKAPFDAGNVPFFNTAVNSPADRKKFADIFRNYQTRIVVYPAIQRLFVMINEKPYVQVKTHPGPSLTYRTALYAEPGRPIIWDQEENTPTDAGNYKILGSTTHYLSNIYRQNTIVPFGAWMVKGPAGWVFQNDDKQWHPLPSFIARDLEQPYGSNDYNYYDVNQDNKGRIKAARWGSHDFGKYALLWTKNGKDRYPELAYCEGELLFDQVIFVKDIAQILTAPGTGDFDTLASKNSNFKLYRAIDDLVRSGGKNASPLLDPVAVACFRLFNRAKLSEGDKKQLNPKLIEAFSLYRSDQLLRDPKYRGLVQYLRDYDQFIRERANWYKKVSADWKFWGHLRDLLQKDLEEMKVPKEKRTLVVEEWISKRLEFGLIPQK
jgi:hypothetical protein